MKSNGVGQLARSPIHLLHRASQAVEDVFATEIKIEHLTPRQLAVLTTVAQNEGLSQTGIVDRTGIDRLKRLKGKGLLQRRRTKEDARAYAVKLTEEGRRVLRTAEPLAKRVDQRILDALPGKAARSVHERLGVDHRLAGAACPGMSGTGTRSVVHVVR